MRLLVPLTAAALAVLVSVAGVAGQPGIVLALLVIVIAFSAGWPTLLGLPTQRGSTTVLALCGGMAVLVVALTGGVEVADDYLVIGPGRRPHEHVLATDPSVQPFQWFAPVLALAVVVSFMHQLMRRDLRPRLVESVTGVVSGVLLVSLASGWVAAALVSPGHGLIHAASLAVVAAAAASALPWPRRITVPLGVVAAGLGSGLVVTRLEHLPTWPGIATGVLIGLIYGSLERLFLILPSAGSSRAAAVAHGSGVVCAAGAATYLTAGLLS